MPLRLPIHQFAPAVTHFALATTALVALGFWVAERAVAITRAPCRTIPLRRALSTAGLGIFLLHVTLAFALVHGWSHARAADATARETLEVVGVSFSGGIWWNYAFTLGWTLDTALWWLAPEWRNERRLLLTGWHVFFAFMAFFSTVVFGTEAARIVGVGGTAFLLLLAARARLSRSGLLD